MIDFNQNVIQLYLGQNSSHLMPRIKTLELYRKNAKKSTDPNVLFQYAQYMLQTALLLRLNCKTWLPVMPMLVALRLHNPQVHKMVPILHLPTDQLKIRLERAPWILRMVEAIKI